MPHRSRLPLLILLFTATTTALSAESNPTLVDYSREIKPLLKSRCFACHGALKQEGGLRLDTGAAIRTGKTDGPVISPGESTGSLIERIRSTDSNIQMPPEGERLTAEQIAKVVAWVEQGAVSPENERPEADPRAHWSYQSPQRPKLPEGLHDAWIKNPIDLFVAQEHARRQLVRQPPATKSALLRRVYLDLIGLPPSSDDLREFLADESADALEKVVNRLLDSPAYGERWARHWMDVWRYADWHGRRYVPDVWNSAPQIWRWRDWIVDSLNQDKSYAQMVAEMLAADEIAPEDDQAGYATGYLIRNWYALNPNDWMRNNVEHTGKAFLGLTLNCAHCHDHKYDPITQEDYFRFRAFFEPIGIRQDQVPGEADPGPYDEYKYGILRKIVRLGAVRIFDKTADAPTWFYTGGDERNRVASRGSIAPGVPAFLSADAPKIAAINLPARAAYPGLRPAIHETVLNELNATLTTLQTQLNSAHQTARETSLDLKRALADAQKEFDDAWRASQAAGRITGVLSGRQSLVISAPTGRRLILNGLRTVHQFIDGTSIRFRLKILNEGYVNFQLIQDVDKGMTAGLVAFEKGLIRSYQPGSSHEWEVGRYDLTKGQDTFEVTFVLRSIDDACRLSVRSLRDNCTIVDSAPVAGNGWTPQADPSKAIAFDVKAGGAVAIDDIEILPPLSGPSSREQSVPPLNQINFESPMYLEGQDVVGVDGWFNSTFSQAGATSLVSAAYGDDQLKPLVGKLIAARQASESVELHVDSLAAKRIATQAQINSANARITADRTKYGETGADDLHHLSREASRLSREAAVLSARAELLIQRHAIAAATRKPADDTSRAKEIDAATKQLGVAAVSLDRALAAMFDAKQVEKYPEFSPKYPDVSTGRRRALAEWITGSRNPLTARVAVNHIWMRHVHAPLVSTVFDFGVSGAQPTHPELLDWLAVEFVESGWSMKHLHRLIVTSGTYALSSSQGASNSHSPTIDPENRYLWRMNRGRMEAEVVRDSLLAVAGRLDNRMGGQELENTQALTTYRRTVYYCCEPEIDGKSAFGILFDAPEPADCYRRTNSIIPQQALALTNSELVHQLCETVAASIEQVLTTSQKTDAVSFVTEAYQRILTRMPTDAELATCLNFLTQDPPSESNASKLRESLIRVLLNHNDFIAIR